MDEYLLIDPTGINLVVYPQGEPIVIEPGTTLYNASTVTGQPITGASETRLNFRFSCDLPESDAIKLEALARKQETTGRASEIVVYFVWDKFSEFSPQTREGLPGVTPDTDGDIISYYPVLQGDLIVTKTLLGFSGSPTYSCDVQFYEGTIRRP